MIHSAILLASLFLFCPFSSCKKEKDITPAPSTEEGTLKEILLLQPLTIG